MATPPDITRAWRGDGRARHHLLEIGTGPDTVVFFPAVGDSASSYASLFTSLATAMPRRVRLVAVDPPGYGRAALPDGSIPGFGELMDWARDLWGDVRDPVIFVGNSSGGAIATAAAAAVDVHTTGLALVGWPDWRVAKMPLQALLPTTFEELEHLLEYAWHAAPPLSPHMAEILLARYAHPGFQEHVRSLQPDQVLARYDGFRGALQFIGGLSDRLVPSRAIEDSAARHPRASVHLIPACGHFPHRECPDALVEILRPFIEAVFGAESGS